MKKIYLTLVISLLLHQAYSQSFYNLENIQKIEIFFGQSNWDALMDAEKAGDENYIMADSVILNGTTFDSVGVKYNGNSTYNANQTKNPLHIELDTYKDHIYQNYTDIKLSNVANDPSFLREVLSYQILRQYMAAPLSNYANVYINGNLMGLYSNSESVSKKFVNNRFYSKDKAFIKCNPLAGAGPSSTSLPTLEYLGTNSDSYVDAYELKSDEGWDELIELCDILNNQTDSIEQILDVDKALWMLAFNNVLVNLDSYIGGFAQNYYLYRGDNGKFNPVVWDLNESFGKFSMTGSGNLNNTTSKQQLSHLLHLNDANYPLISKLLNVPMYKRMYLAHVKTMLKDNFENKSYLSTAETLHALIDDAVKADNNKFYTYNNFVDNINSDITSGGGPQGGSTPGISNLMNARSSYLLGLSDFTATEPSITSVTSTNTEPKLYQTVTITATVSNENAVYLGYRDGLRNAFTRVEMFDDGAHNDGAANDGVYGAELSMSAMEIQYYIYAENDNIGKFSPQNAEHEYHSLKVAATINELVINEFMADNDNTIADELDDFEDWIEIYNTTDDSIFLGDYYLTDDATEPTQFQLPAEYIPAHGFKLIWASGDTDKGTSHANFKLSKGGEEIGLYKLTNSIIDTVDYILFTDQTTDISYGREYDAAENWVFFSNSTPNASNLTVSIDQVADQDVISLDAYPNPYQNGITFSNPTQETLNLSIYSTHGQIIESIILAPSETKQWNDSFASGLRFVVIQSNDYQKVIQVIKH